MRNTRRMAMLGVAIVATGALFAGTAAAEPGAGVTADQAGGTANATAMQLKLFGTELLGSSSSAEVRGAAANASPLAKATVSELLTPAFALDPLTAEVTSRAGGPVEVKPDTCSLQDLEDLPFIVGLKAACGYATADLTDAGGHAKGLGGELLLEPSISELLSTIQLQGPANQVEQGVIDGLNQIVAPLAGNPIGDLANDTVATVDDVLKKVLNLDATVRIAIAPALSEVTQDANCTVARAHAQGVRVELLPLLPGGDINNLLPDDLAANEPLITIIVGEAQAAKTACNDGSAATSESQSAIVKIVFGSTALTDALGISGEDKAIEIGAGQRVCILEGTPLESCVDVATAGVDANGNPYANGVNLDLLKGVNGGIGLTTAGVNSAAAPLLPAVQLPADLPRTGGNAALPLVGGGLLCLAAVTRRFAFGRR
jgi:hypothetical protein